MSVIAGGQVDLGQRTRRAINNIYPPVRPFYDNGGQVIYFDDFQAFGGFYTNRNLVQDGNSQLTGSTRICSTVGYYGNKSLCIRVPITGSTTNVYQDYNVVLPFGFTGSNGQYPILGFEIAWLQRYAGNGLMGLAIERMDPAQVINGGNIFTEYRWEWSAKNSSWRHITGSNGGGGLAFSANYYQGLVSDTTISAQPLGGPKWHIAKITADFNQTGSYGPQPIFSGSTAGLATVLYSDGQRFTGSNAVSFTPSSTTKLGSGSFVSCFEIHCNSDFSANFSAEFYIGYILVTLESVL